ncbi:hypothetical protein HYV79_03855 [Candidatus Woesearchaeota archaeon]|nr:hypothetical protein [Candidatus Woesearchaeota archaeon]
MAKKNYGCPASNWCPTWFGLLVLLVGIWLLLVDMDALPTVNVNWWSLFFVLWGVRLTLQSWCK